MEYQDVLNKADEEIDPIKRIMYVAAFAAA